MANTVTTKAPVEVREVLNSYADLLDMYAEDQLAMSTRHAFARDRQACHTRASVYSSLAIELRETIIKDAGNES